MKKRMVFSFVLMCTLLAASVTFGAFYDGNWLIKGWREHQKIMDSRAGERDYIAAASFSGYVTGVTDVINDVFITIPVGSTRDQICQIVGNYLEKHPEKWTVAADILIADALKEAFKIKR